MVVCFKKIADPDPIAMFGGAGNESMEKKQRQRKNAQSIRNVKSEESEVISINDSEEGKEEESLFRIKCENDAELFELKEENVDDGEDDYYMNDFPTPEVHLEEGRGRKRKQDLSQQMHSDYLEDLQRIGITEEDYLSESWSRGGMEEGEGCRRDRGVFTPLYKLNPDDFAHDPKRQIQIKRAGITYRHHQMKKWMIISQRKEIDKLRRHNYALIAKVIELRGCGCETNQNANIDIIDKVIPSTSSPEKTFANVKWPDVESVKFETLPSSPSPILRKRSSPEKTVETVIGEDVEPAKTFGSTQPFVVNIHSSRLTNLTSNLAKMETKETLSPSPPVAPLKKSPSPVKPRPSPVSRTTTYGPVAIRRIPFSSVSPKKYDNKSPATAVPASKLVFKKKAVDYANLNPLNFWSPNLKYQLEAPLSPTLRFINAAAKANSTVANTDSVGRWIIKSGYQPILPKPHCVESTFGTLDEEIKKREREKLTLEQKFKMLDGDDEEDEVAILATFSSQNHQRKRKAALSKRRKYQEKRKDDFIGQLTNLVKGDVGITEIKTELEERYSDVVFEEAD